MSVSIDHVAMPASNAAVAAAWFAEILGLPAPVADGPDEDLYTVVLNAASSVVFSTERVVPSHHIALGLDEAVVARLRQRGLAFGNAPEDPSNGATSDPLGGLGRVYFRSPDGHFLEITVRPPSSTCRSR